MKKSDRDIVYAKFNGLCAYTGKPLGDDWQVDHIMPQYRYRKGLVQGEASHIDNLFPAISIINHYKRDHNLESFRLYMSLFHKRLAKLPKKTLVDKTKKRIVYMNTVADLFGITPNKPFSGKFYFETL